VYNWLSYCISLALSLGTYMCRNYMAKLERVTSSNLGEKGKQKVTRKRRVRSIKWSFSLSLLHVMPMCCSHSRKRMNFAMGFHWNSSHFLGSFELKNRQRLSISYYICHSQSKKGLKPFIFKVKKDKFLL
jgi:hypothetical protein